MIIFLSCVFFALAVGIDMPYPEGPSIRAREHGNFFCSLGFLFMALHFWLVK